MTRRIRFAGYVAAAALAVPAISLAGPDDTEAPPAAASTPDLSAEAPPDVARRLHLDSLFTQLADPDNDNWQRTQAQIQAAWNRSGSDSMDLLLYRAEKAVQAEDLDTAILHLTALVRLAPAYAEGWNRRATLYYQREDFGRSLEDIARTLELEPRHFGALSGLAIILDRLGDKPAALEAYRRALAVHPHLDGAQKGVERLEPDVDGERL